MKTSTAIVLLAVVALAGLGVYLWVSRDSGERSGGPGRATFGERLGRASGDVADAINSLDDLLGGR